MPRKSQKVKKNKHGIIVPYIKKYCFTKTLMLAFIYNKEVERAQNIGIPMNSITELNFLQDLNDKILVKKQNILRLALAFNKYFLEVSYGTLWQDCCFDIEEDIKNIRKWNTNDQKSIIKIIESIKHAVIEPNGSIPEYFLLKDSINHSSSILNKQTKPYLTELCMADQNEKVEKLINPVLPTNKTHGTATQYICLLNRIQDYYKLSK